MNDKDVLTHAFSEMAPKYEETVDNELQTFWGWSYENFIDKMIELTPAQTQKEILDLATGTGVIPRKLHMANPGVRQIIGLDITPQMLRHASTNKSRNTNLTCASAMQIPLKEHSVDIITCGLATHHMDIPMLLSEIYRVLKPGGYFVIGDVAAANIWKNFLVNALLKVFAFIYFLPGEGLNRARAEAGALSNILSANGWKDLLVKSGFEIEHFENLPCKNFWAPKPVIIRAKKRVSKGA